MASQYIRYPPSLSGGGGSGIITGSGTSGQVAIFDGTTSITSDSSFTYNTSTDTMAFGAGSASHTITGSTIHFQRTGGDCHFDIESLVSGEPALYFNQASRDWIFGVNSSGVIKLNRGNLIASTAALQIDTSGNITFTGSTLNTNAFRSNGGVGVNADPSSTNIANFVSNQAASTRLVLSNSNASGDARIIASSSADTLSVVADADGTILSGSAFGSLNINQSGAKPINFRTNSSLNMIIGSSGSIDIGATGGSATHRVRTDTLQCIASGSTTNFDMSRATGAASLSISGDSGLGNGGEIQLFGGSHASAAAQVRLKTNGTVVVTVNSSGNAVLGSSAALIKGNYHIEPGETNIGNSSTSFSVDWSANSAQLVTMTGNVTSITFSNPQTGGTYVLRIATGAGSFTATGWPASVKWMNGNTPPTITTTASKVDIITFYYDGTNYFGSYTQNY